MKSLNRTLSLVLVLAMVLGLMGIASAAKLSDFTDASKITYVEAVDYLTAAGVVSGETATTINPTGSITREQAAKLVAYACLGKTAADAFKATSAPFTDVAADRWSAGYIAYCVSEGIINGMGDGTFAPTASVTGYQLAKMLLSAVGYGVNGEFTGSAWAIEVAKVALAKGLFAGNLAGANNNAATRQEAFLYTFNALSSIATVKYNTSFGMYYTGTSPLDETSSDPATYIGQSLFSMRVVTGKTDAAGNAGHAWAKSGVTVTGVYTNDTINALGTYTVPTTGADLYANYAWNSTVVKSVNGALTSPFDKTGISRGSSTKFFDDVLGATVNLVDSDSDGDVDRVNITQAYLAKVTSVVAKTATNDRYVFATAYTGVGTSSDFKFYTENFAKGDYILVVPSANAFAASSSYTTVVSAAAANSVTATVTATNATYHTVTADGTTYNFDAKYALGNSSSTPLEGSVGIASKYDFYLDASGLIIGSVVNTSATTTLNYAYIKGVQIIATSALSGVTVSTAQAKIVTLDGTVSIVNLQVKTATAAITTNVGNGNIAIGDKYIVVKNSSNTAISYKVAAGTDTVITGVLADKLTSYVVNSDGTYTFSLKLASTASYPVTATLLNTDAANDDYVTFTKGSAAVTVGDSVDGSAAAVVSTVYATSATKLVTVNAAGTVSSITGYANFVSKTYTVGTDSVSQIVYVANSQGILSSVLVIGAAPVSATAPDAYAFYLSPGNLTADGQYYNFLVGGVVKSYLNASSTTLTSSDVDKAYGIFLDTTGAIATLDFSLTTVGVATVYDGYITVTNIGGTTVIYTSSLVAINVIDVANGNAFADVIETGDKVEIVYTSTSGVYSAAASFIVG